MKHVLHTKRFILDNQSEDKSIRRVVYKIFSKYNVINIF